MSDELYVVARISQEKADISQLSVDLHKISSQPKQNNLFTYTIARAKTDDASLTALRVDLSKISESSSIIIKATPRLKTASKSLSGLRTDLKALSNQGLSVSVKAKVKEIDFSDSPKQNTQSSAAKNKQPPTSSSKVGDKEIEDFIKSFEKRTSRKVVKYNLKNKSLEDNEKFLSQKEKADDSISAYRASRGTSGQHDASKMIQDIHTTNEQLDALEKNIRNKTKSLSNMLAEVERVEAGLADIQKSNFTDDNLNNTVNQHLENVKEHKASIVEMQERNTLELPEDKIKELKGKVNEGISGAKQLVSERSAVGKNAAAYQALISQMDRYYKTNSRIANNPELVKSFNKIRGSAISCNKSIEDLRLEYKIFLNNVSSTGSSGKNAIDDIKEKAKKFTEWFSISQVIMRGVIELQKMYQAVKQVDSAMTELKKVTNETKDSYERFLDGAIVRSKGLGTKVSDLVNSTADFSRVGYNITEASKYAEAATVYKNVGDGIKDIAEASESIISTSKAYGDELKEPMEIVNKFNEIGNNFAISSSGVGEALKRSASALKAAGNDIDESMGLIVAANSVVQDPEVVGTGLKTMSMRIRGASTEDMEDEGLDTDGMAESVSKLREELIQLSGVDIMLDDETFKSTYDIIVELSKVWGTLTDIARANIIEKIAGNKCPGCIEICTKTTTLNPVSTKAFLATA